MYSKTQLYCRFRRPPVNPIGIFVLSFLLHAGSASANDSTSETVDFSINELMQMEVSSASRKSQSLSDTAAAAFIISQEDIRRSGATSIPEILRLAPGVEVARSGSNHWAITARGFNGKYANKLLVLMDGRTIYTPMFSGVLWNLQDTLLEDIERIEVIRGPGAVMWGANAVNGVINIITKKAKDTQGNLFVAGGGNQEQGFAGLRHGGQLGDHGSYRLYAKAFERAAFENSAGQTAHDDWRSAQAGFRVDDHLSSDHRITVQGDVYRKNLGNWVTPVTVLPPFDHGHIVDEHADGANLLARWEGNLSDGSEFKLQGYYDRVSYNTLYISDVQDMLDIDFQHRLHPNASHDLMWGINYRFIHSSAVNSAAIELTPSSLGYHAGSIFVQDDIELIENTLHLVMGTKLEESHFGNTQVQPNVRILWTPNDRHTVWASISRASRTPSRGEAQASIAIGSVSAVPSQPPSDGRLPIQLIALPSADLKAEKVFAAEIGYRTRWTSHFFTDIAAFSNHYTDLIMLHLEPFDALKLTQPMRWYNSPGEVTTLGIELTADWSVFDWLRLSGNYSHLKMEVPDGSDTAELSPRHRASLRCQLDLAEQTKLDLTMRHVSALTAVNQAAPAYTAFDARLSYEPVEGLELSVAAQNLFAPEHLEYREDSSASLSDYSAQVPRSFYGKINWNF